MVGSFLPHPGPLPLGEGGTGAALGAAREGAGCRSVSDKTRRRRRRSLAQRERAGVREKGNEGNGVRPSCPTLLREAHAMMWEAQVKRLSQR